MSNKDKQHRYTPSRLTSTRYHPIMQFIFDQMRDQKCTATVLAEKSGVSRYVIDKWRERPGKKLDNVTRVLTVLGYELTVKPITGERNANVPLPINYETYNDTLAKPKYLDKETPLLARWFISGKYIDPYTQQENGNVFIESCDGDVFENVPLKVATKIIDTRNAFIDAIIECFK